MPRSMKGDAAEFWKKTIAKIDHLTSADQQACEAACELWGFYRAAVRAAQADPVDKDARIAVCQYYEKLDRAITRLCVDPLGRERMEKDKPASDDPLAKYGVVG